jgi:hypothetical protein
MAVQPTSGPPGTGPGRAELLAALSLAIDMGLGQPMEHMLRSSLIAARLADRLGLVEQQRGVVFYANLVAWIGCHADSHEVADWFGDDLAFRADQVSRAKRCADRRFPRSLTSVRDEGMRS